MPIRVKQKPRFFDKRMLWACTLGWIEKYFHKSLWKPVGVLQGQIGIWLNPNDGICHMRSPFKDPWRNEDFFLTLHFRFSIFELNFTKKWKFDVPKKSLFLHESLKGDLIWQIPSFGFSQMPIWPCRTPTGFH